MSAAPAVPARHNEVWSQPESDWMIWKIDVGRESYQDVARQLGRTSEAVRERYLLKTKDPETYRSLTGRAKPTKQGEAWSDEDLALLREKGRSGNWTELARLFGRTALSVEVRYVKLTQGPEAAEHRFNELRGQSRSFLKAKYTGRCRTCSKSISIGSEIYIATDKKPRHKGC